MRCGRRLRASVTVREVTPRQCSKQNPSQARFLRRDVNVALVGGSGSASQEVLVKGLAGAQQRSTCRGSGSGSSSGSGTACARERDLTSRASRKECIRPATDQQQSCVGLSAAAPLSPECLPGPPVERCTSRGGSGSV